jgi:molybdopterin-guanine dinucleotide biosynthesis protein A
MALRSVFPISVVVLAGGEGRRIGGGKPLRRLGGATLIARALDRAHGWSDEVAVSVRATGAGLGADAHVLVDDPAVEGPLAGIASALRYAHSIGREAVLTLPCDTPFLPDDLAERLAAALGEAAAALPASGGRLHPTCALWRSRALDSLDSYLGSGRRSIHGFAAAIGHATAAWPAEPRDPFFNINDTADLHQAEAWLSLKSR